MTAGELHRLGSARRDPAVTLLALLPLALLHLACRGSSRLEAFFLVEASLGKIGHWGVTLLWSIFVLSLFWTLGRIRQLELPWAGAVAAIFLEGMGWALLLGPGLLQITHWLPLKPSSLQVQTNLPVLNSLWNQLAVASGAGLYEELLFRGLALGGGALVLQLLFRRVAAAITARSLAFLLAIVLSSAAFALAHGMNGHPEAFQADILAFRMLAGLAFGLLFAFRGLAVVAYAHFAYDALYLLT